MESINEFISRYKIPILLSFVGLVLIVGGILSSGLIVEPKSTKKSSYSPQSVVNSSQINQIKVDISGAVNNPGVHDVSAESRVEDAIKSAGGFSASASAEFVNKTLNLSAKVSDGQKIYIPFKGENGPAAMGESFQSGGKISLNSGSLSEFDSLSGVGMVTAQKIINNRPYFVIEDLLVKKVVSKSVFEKIKDSLVVN